jgi:hypothetical protein
MASTVPVRALGGTGQEEKVHAARLHAGERTRERQRAEAHADEAADPGAGEAAAPAPRSGAHPNSAMPALWRCASA